MHLMFDELSMKPDEVSEADEQRQVRRPRQLKIVSAVRSEPGFPGRSSPRAGHLDQRSPPAWRPGAVHQLARQLRELEVPASRP
jgi:hypothetical protein